MSDIIEKIKQRIEARKCKITDDAFVPELIGMQYANNMNDWCLEIIGEELAKEPQECKWIPCSERLPEENGHYLVTYHHKSYGNYLPLFDDIYVRKMRFQNEKWMFPFNLDKEAREDEFQEVIAWQQLPSVWKGENNG